MALRRDARSSVSARIGLRSLSQYWSIGLLVGLLSGCAEQTRSQTISADPMTLVEAAFEPQRTQIVGGRYLLLPVTWPPNSKGPFFGSGGPSYLSAAWATGELNMGRYLNLRVVDLVDQREDAVFSRQVALINWERSFGHDWGAGLQYADRLVLVARTQDTDGDQSISGEDDVQVFVYDLAHRKLTATSPEGYSVEKVTALDAAIVLVVKGKDGATAVYRVDPITCAGAFVVDGMQP